MLEHMSKEMWESMPLNKKKNAAPENKVKAAVMKLMEAMRIPCNRQQSGKVLAQNPKTRKPYWMQLAKKGSGDLVVCLPPNGRYCEIETKAAGKSLNPDQCHRKAEIEAAGGLYIEAHDIDDVLKVIRP